MAKLVKQVSIESPTHKLKECIFNFETPMPDLPQAGARIKVRNAGVCYRLRSASSTSSIKSVEALQCGSPLHQSVRDTSLFPGYEVAGTVEALGAEVGDTELRVGDRVIVYPYEGHPPGYAEYIAVPDIQYLVKVPDNMSLSVAAMLPSGALWAMNTVFSAHTHVEKVLSSKGETGNCKILLVGTGGLALWAMRIARYYWPQNRERIEIVVASLRDEGISIALEHLRLASQVRVVQWSEDLYEQQLVERTKDACGGAVDIVIDFSATSRSIRRALKCLAPNGVMLMSSETAEGLIARFSKEAEKANHQLIPIEFGSLNQLKNLVHLVSTGELEPPPHTIFSADRANEAIAKIGRGLIQGRAILEFPEDDEEGAEE
ncbi:death resistor Adh domain containing target isoform X1 [Oratosquilla oratoria]|uniref:death resistor Adh domain containing target isoform X1 n=1 Tax=Oratosquilla oratoria TaxID=337810 RepID=UPI003F76AD28